jgi:UDP-N-acetylmuramate dehydrogenase
VVPREEAVRIQALAGQQDPATRFSIYPASDGRVKLPAAWLIEHSGFSKGFARGPIAISRKHALAIVNRGGATARDIVALKNEIQYRVHDLWGILLEPEPVFLGFEPDELNRAQ